MMRNIKLTIEYDGTNYCGWQRQRSGLAIQEVLENAIAKITREEIKIVASGRTDAGVHAYAQTANFRSQTRLSPHRLLAGINSILPSDIVIKSLEDVALSFHSRRDAQSKEYLYFIANGTVRQALLRNYVWQVAGGLDIEAMREAALLFIGRHDFRSFCSSRTDVLDFEREVFSLTIKEKWENILMMSVEANGFLRHMVRTMVGTLVAVGRGKIEPDIIPSLLAACDRSKGGATAPPQGLFLKAVRYPPSCFSNEGV